MSKICIVISTYNSGITNQLYNSTKKKLLKSKINKIHTVKVPGSFEIPVAISRLSKKYDGFIAIGCIIKGETENFNLISKSITDAIMLLSTVEKKPIGNAILTCFNKKQALKRFDKGSEAANAVIEVLKNVPRK
tara:strand:+ start:2153 stop:2554 length:402 start_codon:yes stop_codon:yes gene_type:complete